MRQVDRVASLLAHGGVAASPMGIDIERIEFADTDHGGAEVFGDAFDLLCHLSRIVHWDLIRINLSLGRLLHDLLQRVVRIAFAAAAEETPERIAANAILAPVAQPSAELATVDFGMRRFALVELPLWTNDTVASRGILF